MSASSNKQGPVLENVSDLSATTSNVVRDGLYQLAGALSPISPFHRLQAGDPHVRLEPTPGRLDDTDQSLVCVRCSRAYEISEFKTHVQVCAYVSPRGAAKKSSFPSRPPPIPGLPACDLCSESLRIDADSYPELQEAYYMNTCEHVFSQRCLAEYLEAEVMQPGAKMCTIQCPAPHCGQPIPAYDLLNFITEAQHDQLLRNDLDGLVERGNGQFVNCPNCDMLFEKVANVKPLKVFCKEISGKALTQRHYDDYQCNRLRCPACSTEFCGECCVTPYHLGNTCAEYQDLSEATLCRFCNTAVQHPPDMAMSPRRRKPQICGSPECEINNVDACKKTLPCGHACPGIVNEASCPPCFVKGCSTEPAKDGTTWCSICYVGDLRSAPCIVLACGHMLHYKCVTKQLLQKWPGARISFGFMSCPECSAEIAHPALAGILKDLIAFRKEVRSGALLRLKHEGLDRDAAVTSSEGAYHNDAASYAEAILSYYQCYVCERPYFGGIKRCEDMQDEQGKYNPSELVCAACVPFTELRSCRLHGSEFIEYKCKFCCSVAQWFCWGTTHFCVTCHRMQERGDFVTKKKLTDLPSCEGRKTCPLKVEHPSNGTEEFALGCAVCRLSGSSF